jgi:hypothetical protein
MDSDGRSTRRRIPSRLRVAAALISSHDELGLVVSSICQIFNRRNCQILGRR